MEDLERYVDVERYRKIWSSQFKIWPQEFDKTLHWKIFMLFVDHPDTWFTRVEVVARLGVSLERGIPQFNHLTRIIMSDSRIEVAQVAGRPERVLSYKLHTGLFRYKRRRSKN